MSYEDFLGRILEDGICAAEQSYAKDPSKRRGAIAGFRACEGKSPAQLLQLLRVAEISTRAAGTEADASNDHDVYWEARSYESEVEWVCNCVSAMLLNEGLPTLVTPTARGAQKAAAILGVTNVVRRIFHS